MRWLVIVPLLAAPLASAPPVWPSGVEARARACEPGPTGAVRPEQPGGEPAPSARAAAAARGRKPGPARKKPATAPAKARPVPPNAQGQVTSVTAEAAFLDRGSADGLQVGQELTFTRSGKPAGKCTVAAVADHYARCAAPALRVGDRFAVARAVEKAPSAPTTFPSEAELLRRAEAIESLAWRLRDFDAPGGRSSGLGTRVEALFSHTTYGNLNSGNGAFGVQRIDVAAYDVELWKGLRVSADLTVLNFSARPTARYGTTDAPLTRTVYQQSPVLLVRQLELGFRRADLPISGALGRTWLRTVTGTLVIDGAQAAWRFGEGFELGAYGGLLPSAARLEITPSQWAAGAFGRVRFSSGTGAAATLGQVGVRAGYALRDQLGGRGEVNLTASLWKGPAFDAHTSLEFGFGQTTAPGALDAARLDVGWRPTEAWRVSGGVRYRGLPLTALTEVGTVSPGQRAIHGDLGVSYQLSEAMLLGLSGGVASDFDSGLVQGRVGPELVMPRLLQLPVGMTVGYQEELGWVRGRHGYLQLNVAPLGLFRVLSRVSWFNQQRTVESAGLAQNELGGTFALEVTPWRYVNARVLVTGRVPLTEQQRGVLGSVGFQLGGAF